MESDMDKLPEEALNAIEEVLEQLDAVAVVK